VPTTGKKLTRSAAAGKAALRGGARSAVLSQTASRAAGPRRTGAVPALALGSGSLPRLITAGPPAEWRFDGLTVVIGTERAELRYAREPVGSAQPAPDAIFEAVARARRRLAQRSRGPDELLPALAQAYAVVLARRRGQPGDRVPLVEVRDELADGTHAQFAWDVARLRREHRLVIGGCRVDLGVATGHATARRSQIVWIEDDGGGGSYFASFRLIAQEIRS
jgi:hypothetical protein